MRRDSVGRFGCAARVAGKMGSLGEMEEAARDKARREGEGGGCDRGGRGCGAGQVVEQRPLAGCLRHDVPAGGGVVSETCTRGPAGRGHSGRCRGGGASGAGRRGRPDGFARDAERPAADGVLVGLGPAVGAGDDLDAVGVERMQLAERAASGDGLEVGVARDEQEAVVGFRAGQRVVWRRRWDGAAASRSGWSSISVSPS